MFLQRLIRAGILGTIAAAQGCHAADPPMETIAATAPAQLPRWILIRVEGVRVSAVHPETQKPWDSAALTSRDTDAECSLIGAVAGLAAGPIAGKGLQFLCQQDLRPDPLPKDPTAPDLVVTLSVGDNNAYRTYTAWNTSYQPFHSEFVIPVAAIPAEGISFTVIDRDEDEGNSLDTIGIARLTQQQLLAAGLSSHPLITLSDPGGGMQRLELLISPYYEDDVATGKVKMDAREGSVVAPVRPIRAGEVLEVTATGEYSVGGLFHDRLIDPTGYPGHQLTEYNFKSEPFASALHGAAIAIVGRGDAKQRELVDPCARFLSRVGGAVVVGVNDVDAGNDRGWLQFSVRVRGPTPDEWLAMRAAPCIR